MALRSNIFVGGSQGHRHSKADTLPSERSNTKIAEMQPEPKSSGFTKNPNYAALQNYAEHEHALFSANNRRPLTAKHKP